MIVICLEINKYRCLPIINGLAWHGMSLPSVIYSLAICELVEQEIQKPHSCIIDFAQIAFDRGRNRV